MIREELIDWNEYPCGANSEIYSKYFKKMIKGNVMKNGYVQVWLKCIDGKYRNFRWHRVIYTYFYGTIPEGMQVNHKNEIKTDNRLCNLELVTPKENSNWGTRTKRSAAKRRGVPRPDMIEQNKRFKSKSVVAVDKSGNVLEFKSIIEVECKMGFKHQNVSSACRNCFNREGNRYYKGYYWYFKEDWLKMKGVA